MKTLKRLKGSIRWKKPSKLKRRVFFHYFKGVKSIFYKLLQMIKLKEIIFST
jgi:hypothetical protein